mmetsp:Transcript_242/g.401  ORF Transcript_242/g.401 Transcript_242/m.401 type:complete len:93 (-) Transcript_242:265-543(-)
MSLLKELGMTDSDRISADVSHNFIFTLSPSLEKVVIRSILPWFAKTGRALAVVSYAIAGYLICAGTARLIEASRKPSSSFDDGAAPRADTGF